MMIEHGAGRPAQGLTSNVPFVSGHGRAQVVLGLFIAFTALKAVAVVSCLMQVNLLSEALAGGVTQEQAEWNDQRQAIVAVLTLVVFVALVVAFLMWLHRVMENLPALGNAKTRVEVSPGWAVGSFFVPFMNLFIPYRAVKEAWVKSDPAVRTEEGFMFSAPSPTGLIFAWWVSWIAMNFISRAASGLESAAKTADSMIGATWVALAADLAAALSAGLAIQVVRGLDMRQEERSRNVAYVPDTPPPPPLSTPTQP